MRLTDSERKILRYAQLRAGLSMVELAKLSGFPEHTVRRCLHKLYEQGIIRPTALIDLFPLGVSRYNLLFSLA